MNTEKNVFSCDYCTLVSHIDNPYNAHVRILITKRRKIVKKASDTTAKVDHDTKQYEKPIIPNIEQKKLILFVLRIRNQLNHHERCAKAIHTYYVT